MRISIVVPVHNEARGIVATLATLQPLRAAGHEVIVVDGDSADATVALAAPLADRVLAAKRGRASQMNAGAGAATGDVLLFLHADTRLPAPAVATLVREMARTGRRWGRFDVTIEGRSRALALVAAAMNARSRVTGIATGDQAIFVERALFAAAGGFPDQPLMEDIELSRRLKRSGGAPLALRERVVTSGRRWDRHGAWQTIVAMWRLRLAYWAGADPARLAARYGTTARCAPVSLLVFAKAPVPGRVKTRLAEEIGEREAAALAAELVERTVATAVAARDSGIVGQVELWCAPDATSPVFTAWRDRHGVVLHTQSGGDLGERMRGALDAALARGTPAILIGADCPALDAGYLAAAASALDDNDAVFGPAEDGGYVLVGLARSVDAFTGVPWSTPVTMEATRDRLRACRARWRELPVLWDVDEPADLARWIASAERAGTAAAAAQAAG